ncbi:MAG TPA: hypothetical protein VFZ24_18370 [Longimicrobiales bacterium]
MAFVGACDEVPGDAGPRVLELASDTIQLEPGTELVEVTVRRSASGDFDPGRAEARTGDVVRFSAADNGGHAIVFEGAALSDSARAWLERTAQLRGPPLIESGAAWVITLAGAPPGDYPFHCTTHNRSGHLVVAPR